MPDRLLADQVLRTKGGVGLGEQRGILMRSSVDVPTVIILIGVIGGLLAYGLIGVFLGPVIIALGYELFRAWVRGEQTVLRQTTA